MKTQEMIVKVIDKENKSGTNNSGQKWEMTEYTVEENMEREDGSIFETKVKATTSQAVGDLDLGGVYKVVIFITSRESEKDGKKILWNSFRITRAEKIGGEEPKEEPTTIATSVADEIPFNEVP